MEGGGHELKDVEKDEVYMFSTFHGQPSLSLVFFHDSDRN